MTLRTKITGLTFALTTLSAVVFIAPAIHAQSSRVTLAQYCAQLEGELARIQRAGQSRSSRQFEKYDAAVHKQLAQLDSANRLAKRDGCNGRRIFLFRRTPKASCPALLKRIGKMERNLAALEKKRSRYAPAAPQDNGMEKARILRELGNAGCGNRYDRFARDEPIRKRRGLFGSIFRTRESNFSQRWGYDDRDIPQVGTYKTVCVRACDGYFFPISFSTTEGSFGRDKNTCHSRCPGADVELYIYQNPGETPQDMRSLDGRAYNSLETAFLYQKEYVANCSCQAPKSQLASIAGDNQLPSSPANPDTRSEIGAAVPAGPIVPLPMPKQSIMVDPDTRATERLGIAFSPYKPPEVRSDKGVVHTSDGRSIRIVGPKFFGSQE
nr:DUF2865 domain-containing protein [uncultured Cohaesibacter sp.]